MANLNGESVFSPARKKHICFITTLPCTLKAFVQPQAEYLLKNGWDVTWVCAEDLTFYEQVPMGVRYIPLKLKRGMDYFGVPRAMYELYCLFNKEQFDIVQYSTPNAAFYAGTAAWVARVPVRLYAQWGIRYVGFEGIRRKIFKLLERWCCRCSSVIEPDSYSNLEFSVQERLYSRSKARVIWNGSACGVNIQRFDITKKDEWRAEYRGKLGLDSSHLVVGFVGSIREDKGCNELIGACRSFFAEMTAARLLLVGEKQFYDSIMADLRDWVASSPQVIHVPPNSEIPQYMSCMDVFSLPSYREGFGTVIVEAEAMGVPVVVSDVPGPIDAMRHEVTGLVVPVKNTEALARALQLLLADSATRDKYGASAAVFSCSKFEQEEFCRHALEDKERLLATEAL